MMGWSEWVWFGGVPLVTRVGKLKFAVYVSGEGLLSWFDMVVGIM